MNSRLRRRVRERAQRRCEYCQMPEGLDELPFHVDHVIAQKHRGPTSEQNLAWACFQCNEFKGPNPGGISQVTGDLVRLFHPRRDLWHEHFEWNGPYLDAKTEIGAVTIDVLCLNLPERVALRASLIEEGLFPPNDQD